MNNELIGNTVIHKDDTNESLPTNNAIQHNLQKTNEPQPFSQQK